MLTNRNWSLEMNLMTTLGMTRMFLVRIRDVEQLNTAHFVVLIQIMEGVHRVVRFCVFYDLLEAVRIVSIQSCPIDVLLWFVSCSLDLFRFISNYREYQPFVASCLFS